MIVPTCRSASVKFNFKRRYKNSPDWLIDWLITLEKFILIDTLSTPCALFTRDLLATARLLYCQYLKLQKKHHRKAHIIDVITVFSTNCHQLSPRLLAEPWRLKGGAWEQVGMRVNAVCLQQFHQFIQLVLTCISTRREHSVRSYILLQCHRYTESPRCSLLETANRPDAAIACSLM